MLFIRTIPMLRKLRVWDACFSCQSENKTFPSNNNDKKYLSLSTVQNIVISRNGTIFNSCFKDNCDKELFCLWNSLKRRNQDSAGCVFLGVQYGCHVQRGVRDCGSNLSVARSWTHALKSRAPSCMHFYFGFHTSC